MKMLPNEEVITLSNGITLTNQRIRHTFDKGGDRTITSLLLENIQSISIRYTHKPLLLIVGILLIAASIIIFNAATGILIIGSVIGLVFIVYYFETRKHYLSVASAAGAIHIRVKGQDTTKLLNYIDTVEEAICKHKQWLQGYPTDIS